MKRILLMVLVIILFITMTACNSKMVNHSEADALPDIDGNPYTTHEVIDGKTYISYDYSEVYDSLDLTQYTSWGSFGADGLMWVEKSDYTGKQFGYIDYKGNIVIPFSSEIVTPGEFEFGYAIISYEYDGLGMGNGVKGVMDVNGEIKLKFDNHATSECYRSENGNIVFVGINLMDDLYSEPKNYIFCSKSGKTIEIPDGPAKFDGMYYSDGLLRTYRTEWYTDENNETAYKHVVTFYDENGDVALVVDSNSSPHFKSLTFVDDFVDGKAIVTFVGQDREYYRVEIDKNGQWMGEPWQIDRDDLGNGFF